MSQLSRSELKLITGLDRRKVRESEGLFLAEGIRVVEELLAARVPIRVAAVSPDLSETERGRALAGALASRGVAREVRKGEMARLADTSTSQGVLVVAEAPRAGLAALVPTGRAVLLVLDGVQDPGNLGTLSRSAAAFGCSGLLCLTGTVDPWNAKAVRASAGALFHLPVAQAATVEGLDWLAAQRFALLGADAGGEAVESVARGDRTALVVGNEGAGLSAEVRAGCERLVAVPMRKGTESLNVAVATGILLYVMTRGRK